MKCGRICSFLLLIFYGLDNIVVAAEPNSASCPSWNTTLSYGDWTDSWPTVMKITGGYLITGISHRIKDEGSYEYKVVLWKIDLQGKELWAKDINIPAWQDSFVPSRCFSLPDEPTVFVVESLGPHPRRAWLVRLDDNGSITSSIEFSSKIVLEVDHMIKTKGGFLFYGSINKGIHESDAVVIKTDFDGNEIWRREYDKGKMESVSDIALQKDGGFILGIDSGAYNKFGGGPSEAWIVKCDRDGNILNETTFEGRHPTVTVNGDITAVVFNKADFPQQDISVAGLDEKLKTIWKIDSLLGKTGGTGMLKTIVNKQGDFILAGNNMETASIRKIGKDGNILEEIKIENAKLCVQFESLLQTPTGYLVAGHVPKMSKMPRTADGQRDKKTQWDNMDILVAEVADLSK